MASHSGYQFLLSSPHPLLCQETTSGGVKCHIAWSLMESWRCLASVLAICCLLCRKRCHLQKILNEPKFNFWYHVTVTWCVHSVFISCALRQNSQRESAHRSELWWTWWQHTGPHGSRWLHAIRRPCWHPPWGMESTDGAPSWTRSGTWWPVPPATPTSTGVHGWRYGRLCPSASRSERSLRALEHKWA